MYQKLNEIEGTLLFEVIYIFRLIPKLEYTI